MLTLQLSPRASHRIAEGHLWVYKNDLKDVPPAPLGSVVSVVSPNGISLGTGLYNHKARVAVRMLGGSPDVVDTAFFVTRIKQALDLRKRILPNEDAYRVVFSESDLLSGLILDRYADVIVLQTLSAGMDSRLPQIIEAIREVMPEITGIVERNSSKVRLSEELELRDGVVWGEVPDRLKFTENGLKLEVDLLGGQKTGYYLDQKINRKMVAGLCKDKSVLDLFCNTGGFALNAAAAGASDVLGVDSSKPTIEHAAIHAEVNGLAAKCRFAVGNAFDALHEALEAKKKWDVIILDPPSFAKRRDAVERAKAGYSSLNRAALKVLAPGGILVSASCTQLVPEYDLMDILYTEAARVKKRLRLLHRGQQSPHHPILLAMPETQYLKFLVFDAVPVD